MEKNLRKAVKKILGVKSSKDLRKLFDKIPEHLEYKPEITLVSPSQKKLLAKLLKHSDD